MATPARGVHPQRGGEQNNRAGATTAPSSWKAQLNALHLLNHRLGEYFKAALLPRSPTRFCTPFTEPCPQQGDRSDPVPGCQGLRAQQILESVLPFMEQEVAVTLQEVDKLAVGRTHCLIRQPGQWCSCTGSRGPRAEHGVTVHPPGRPPAARSHSREAAHIVDADYTQFSTTETTVPSERLPSLTPVTLI